MFLVFASLNEDIIFSVFAIWIELLVYVLKSIFILLMILEPTFNLISFSVLFSVSNVIFIMIYE